VKLLRKPEGVEFPNYLDPDEFLKVKISNLGQILIEHTKDNIWRSWELFSEELCNNSVGYLPLLLDIDKKEEEPNLKKMRNLTLRCLDLIEKNTQFVKPGSLRVIFSGHKGFHIEAIPVEPVNNRDFREYVLHELEKAGLRWRARNEFVGGTIDSTDEPFVRVTDSYNSWENEDGILKRRKVIQYTHDEFRKLQIEDIIARSEATK